MDERRWKIGEVARATGLTVRTLHHYDELGLLRPAERTGAGHRIYTDADVRRLYRIVALRGVGLPLDEVAAALDRDGDDPRPAIRAQLDRLDRELSLAAQLRRRLVRILDALEAGNRPSITDLITAIEETTMLDQHYTPEQLAQLEERRRALGPEGMERVQHEWAELIEAMRAEQRAGTDPGDPGVRPLAVRWAGLIEQFTGGDAGIRASLQRMYETEGPEQASRGAVDAELMAYAMEAIEAAREAGELG
jgi:DNA-binding transcriptional MerR regulator